MSYKICTKCHKNKHKGKSFMKDSSKSDGLYSSCKDCYRKRIGSKKRLSKQKLNKLGEVVRLCTTCRKYKELRKFYKNGYRKDGLHTDCKNCSIQRGKSEARKAGQKGRRQRERMVVLLHYSNENPKCACCGERENKFLCIDHINGGGKKHRKITGSHFYRWVAKNGFPKGLQVLCHNCNMAKGFYGKCPHETN